MIRRDVVWLFSGVLVLASSLGFAQENDLLNQKNNDWFLLGSNKSTGESVFADRVNVKISKVKKNDVVDVLIKLTRPCPGETQGTKCYAVIDYSFNCTKSQAKIVRGQLFNTKTDKLVEDYGLFSGGYKDVPANAGTPVSLAMTAVCDINQK